MRNTGRNGFMITFVLTVLTATVMMGAAGPAYADDCLALGGNPAFLPGECRIDAAKTASDAAHGGPFTISEPLRITETGSITVPSAPGGNALTLKIAGDLTLDSPLPTVAGAGRISGDVTTATGTGATITIDATGNIVVHGGARITSNQKAGSCSGGRGGNISLFANGSIVTEAGSAITSTAICGQGEIIIVADISVTLKGVASSDSTFGRGGPVSVSAGCILTVAPTGRVTSQGKDPGADLVHLQGGCDVLIQGKVESTGPGHVRPLANRCHAPDRPDKPGNAPACVEVWSGGTLTVDSTGTLKGEINADTAQTGGVNCCAWIDLFALGDILITGDTTGVFAVHANQSNLSTAFGGYITVKSKGGNVTASGLAIQATATQSGGTGGIVTIEAKGNVTLDEAQILAKGDAVAGGGFGTGGTVGARAFTGTLNWVNTPGGVTATGDVQPTGTGIPAAQRGVILLTSCLANPVGDPIHTSGTSFPVTLPGTPPTPLPAFSNVCSPAAPDWPSYVLLPECVCAYEGTPDVILTKTATPPTVIAGGTASYTITVIAGGDANSTNVKLTDALPTGFSWTLGGTDAQSCSPPPPGPIAGGTTLTCSFGTMAPGDSKTITLSTLTSITAHCPTGVTITNTATVTYDGDRDTDNDSSGPVTIAVKCPDVSVVKTTTTPTITAGANAVYKVVVTAGASSRSTNVVLTDVLPAGLNWAVTGDATFCSPTSPVAGGATLTCTFGTMALNATKTITLTATTSTANCPAINNTATVSSDGDTNSSNNTSGPVTIAISCPDVKVVKTTTTPAIIVGDQAIYNVAVTAKGSGNSTNVVLTDTLPAGLTWTVSGATASTDCTPFPSVTGGNTLTCTFGNMAPNTTKAITLTAPTSTANCPAINNTATVSADADTNAGNNSSAPVTITVNCTADVQVSKTTTTPTITAGGQASYGITVTANGPAHSTHVVLTDTLPAGLNWTVGGSDAGSCSPGSPVTGGTTLTCSFGTMAPNTTKAITLTAPTSTANCPGITNTASVSADVDTNSSNNTSGAVTITVNCAADVQVVKTTTTPIIKAGTQASYSITVTANGPTNSTHVVLTDTLPAGLNWTVTGPDAGACLPASPVTGGTALTCTFGTMAQGTTKAITLTAPTLSANCPAIKNTATVSADVDTTPSNNTSGPVKITVLCDGPTP